MTFKKGDKYSEEHKQNLKAARLRYWAEHPEQRKETSERFKRFYADPKNRDKVRKTALALWKTPKYRAAMKIAMGHRDARHWSAVKRGDRIREVCDCGLLPKHQRGKHGWCCQICGGKHAERICPNKNLGD